MAHSCNADMFGLAVNLLLLSALLKLSTLYVVPKYFSKKISDNSLILTGTSSVA